MTISEFCEQRLLRFHAVSPGTRQKYGYVSKNHNAQYHPSGKAGWFTKPHRKNGDWRRFDSESISTGR
jgi:hypothetical protein